MESKMSTDDVDTKRFGFSPLHNAVFDCNVELVIDLIDKGEDMYCTTKSRYTPIDLSVVLRYTKLVRMFLKYDSKIGKKVYSKTVHKIAEDKDETKLEAILESMLSPSKDVKNVICEDCLQIAVQLNKIEIVNLVCREAPNNMMHCASKALDYGHHEIALLLLSYTATIHNNHEFLELLFGREPAVEESDCFHQYYSLTLTWSDIEKLRCYTKNDSVSGMVKNLMFKCSGVKTKLGQKCLKVILLSKKYCCDSRNKVNWEQLGLTHLEESYINDIVNYHKLSLVDNLISHLPWNLEVLVNLTHLDLSQNKVQEIPVTLLQLPCLRRLNLSCNLIESLPQTNKWSPLLRALSLSGNLLTSLPSKIDSKITYLSIANNKFKEFPMVICNMKTLETLDITGNKDIKKLPIQLGYNTNLKVIYWEGLNVRDIPIRVHQSRETLLSHMRSKAFQAEPHYTMKIAVLGQANHGKTTLIRRLLDVSGGDDTLGGENNIDVQELVLSGSNFTDPRFHFNVWDFAGKEEFYVAHKCFLTEDSLNILVFDVTEVQSGVRDIEPWLVNLASYISKPNVIIIGTKLDRIPKKSLENGFKDYIEGYLKEFIKTFEPKMRNVNLHIFEVISLEDREAIKKLRETIYRIAKEMKIMPSEKLSLFDHYERSKESVMGREIPKSFTIFEREVREKHSILWKPLIHHEDFRYIMRNDFIQEQLVHYEIDEAIKDLTRFLKAKGTLVHFDCLLDDLDDFYFTDPSWLYQLLCCAVKILHKTSNHGRINLHSFRNDLKNEKINFSPLPFKTFLRILYKFQIIIPISADDVLVPSQLYNQPYPMPKQLEFKDMIIRRHVFLLVIPHGFMERLLSRLLFFMKEMMTKQNLSVDATGSEAVLSNDVTIEKMLLDRSLICWKNGIQLELPNFHFSIRKEAVSGNEILETRVLGDLMGYQVLGYIIKHIQTVITEWFSNFDLFFTGIRNFAACPVCTRDGCQKVNFINIEDAFLKYNTKMNDNDAQLSCKGQHLLSRHDVEKMFPELFFKDLPKDLLIDKSTLHFTESGVFAQGAFGDMYHGYHTTSKEKLTPVFIKTFNGSANKETNICELLNAFFAARHETFFLNQLQQNPFIVRLIGISIQTPFVSLVTELASHGALRDILYNKAGRLPIKRILLFRIIKQVANALVYMHQRNIVHRKIRSGNILISELDEQNLNIIVKLGNFEITDSLTPDGMKKVYNFIVPDIRLCKGEYDVSVDIYSFSMVIGEMINGRPSFRGIDPFALKDGQPPSSYEDTFAALYGLLPLTDLRTKMWKEKGTDRPTAEQTLRQAQDCCFQLFYGKKTFPTKVIPLSAVGEKTLWIEYREGIRFIYSGIDMTDLSTSSIASSYYAHHPTEHLISFDGHSVAVIVSKNDSVYIRVWTASKDSFSQEEYIDCTIDEVSFYVHRGIIYIAFAQASFILGRVSLDSFTKGRFNRDISKVHVSGLYGEEARGKFTSLVVVQPSLELSIIIANGRRLYKIITFDDSLVLRSSDLTVDKKLTTSDLITNLVLMPCDQKVAIGLSNGVVRIISIDSLVGVVEVKIDQFFMERYPFEKSTTNLSIVSVCFVLDVMWVGLQNGLILIYDLGEVECPIFLTCFKPYQERLRRLLLWKVTPVDSLYGVEYLIISIGDKLNSNAFGETGVCRLNTLFPPRDAKETLKAEHSESTSTILFWQAVDANTMRIIMQET
uniref:Non-specific serine/threonine protein kinase n=1 Tax=Clytia hemisphaerica TaxID=252671 RepID=A0A7M5UXB7_9CNID